MAMCENKGRLESTEDDKKAWLVRQLRELADSIENGPAVLKADLKWEQKLRKKPGPDGWAVYELTGERMLHVEWKVEMER